MSEERTNKNTTNETTNKNTKPTNADLNEVLIQGRIVHRYAAEKATILTVSTGRATIAQNHPKVVFFGEIKDEAAKYDVGSFVKITGNIQSSKRNPSIKNQSTLSVFGESIGPATTQFEEDHGIPGSYAPAINHFKLAGTITSIDIPTKNIVRLTVKCIKNGRPSFVTLIFFSQEPAKVVAAHLPGSFIRASGCVQTSKSTKGGETSHYQSYVASELM